MNKDLRTAFEKYLSPDQRPKLAKLLWLLSPKRFTMPFRSFPDYYRDPSPHERGLPSL